MSLLCLHCAGCNTRHALIVTQSGIWTTIHVKHGLTDDELRRKCDLHLIYLGGEAFGILKPKFEWKYDVPLGHIAMVEPTDKPLQDTTEEVLSKEANVKNTIEVKDEPQENMQQTQIELLDVTPPVAHSELPDATCNLIVFPSLGYAAKSGRCIPDLHKHETTGKTL